MLKRAGILLFVLTVLISCNKRMEQALKSSDKDFILQVADEFYEEGKWANAIDLYSKIMVAFAGTEQGPDIAYKQADANFQEDRKSTRLNSSHVAISYAVFCLKKKKY